MKPVTTNNLSAWGFVGLFILFSMPYIGTPALILCALFARDHSAKSFARAIILFEVIVIVLFFVLVFALALLGDINLGEIFEDFNFDFSGDEGTAFINNVRYYLGV